MTAIAHSNRLRRFSNAMVIVTSLGIALIAGLMILVLSGVMVLMFFLPDWTHDLLLARLGNACSNVTLTSGRVAAAAGIIAIPVGVLLFGLWQARALFADFAEGRVFTLTSARYLRDFAACVLAQAILGPLSSAALFLALTFSNPPGNRQFAISLSLDNYVALIVGGVLLAVAWVMVEATRIADEHASFV
jgi:Protein of unknown function (DUF2975)